MRSVTAQADLPDRAQDTGTVTTLSRRVRPLDAGTTESIRVISFVWRSGPRIQPVLWLDRELLH